MPICKRAPQGFVPPILIDNDSGSSARNSAVVANRPSLLQRHLHRLKAAFGLLRPRLSPSNGAA